MKKKTDLINNDETIPLIEAKHITDAEYESIRKKIGYAALYRTNTKDEVKLFEFKEVSFPSFAAYIEGIKQELKKEAPEWKVNVIQTPVIDMNPAISSQTVYHLCQWDFTNGVKQLDNVILLKNVFAYSTDDTYFIYTQHPIIHKPFPLDINHSLK